MNRSAIITPADAKNRRWIGAVTAAVMVGLLAWEARAASCYWDLSTDAGLQAGSGTWSTSAANWSTSTGGSNPTVVWANNNTARFGGAAGTYVVTLDSTVTTASQITFEASGYTLQADSDLSVAVSPAINVKSGVTATIGNHV